MFTAQLSQPDTYACLLQHPVWQRALQRLALVRPDDPDANIPWEGEDMYVMIQGYSTQSRDLCRFEAHRRYIDIQYLMRGEEIIEVSPLDTLEVDVPYLGSKDVAFFRPSETPGADLRMRPGDFAIFLPHDAHRPKIQVSTPSALRKAVVKIDLKLFAT
jgi:biofilm protein TabA